MNRRELLGTLGAVSGVGTLGGCLAEQKVECLPGDDHVELGTLDRESESTASFQGAVVAIADGVLVDDSTGVAYVTSTDEQYIQTGNLQVGSCLSGSGVGIPEASWRNRVPVLTVTRLEVVGEAKRRVSGFSEVPGASFDVSLRENPDNCQTTVEIEHTGGEQIPAENLLVAHRNPETPVTDEQTDWWYDISEAEPWDAIGEGDAVRLSHDEGRVGTLAWVDDWSKQLTGWEVEGC